jgi:hypothetical protein
MESLDRVNWLVPTHWSYSHVSKTMHFVLYDLKLRIEVWLK